MPDVSDDPTFSTQFLRCIEVRGDSSPLSFDGKPFDPHSGIVQSQSRQSNKTQNTPIKY